MDDKQLFILAIGVALSIISFYLKSLISELKELEAKVNTNTTKIEVLQSNHGNLEKKIDSIYDAVKELSGDIKHLNQK